MWIKRVKKVWQGCKNGATMVLRGCRGGTERRPQRCEEGAASACKIVCMTYKMLFGN